MSDELSAGLANLARNLWMARRDGGVVDPDQVTAPRTDAEAYAVQWEIARLSGAAVEGFKVGSTSREAQRILGTNEPGSAPVLSPYLYESPARIPLEAKHLPSIEGEFAFRLATMGTGGRAALRYLRDGRDRAAEFDLIPAPRNGG